jgi:hypothetical protein
MREFPHNDPMPMGWLFASEALRREADMCIIEQNKFWEDIRLILSENSGQERRNILTAYSLFKSVLYRRRFDAIIRTQSLRMARPVIRRILQGLKVTNPF